MYEEYQQFLMTKSAEDPFLAEQLDEEINIVIHKLKYIPTENRPKALLLSDARTLEQDFSALVKESVEIAGGHWLDVAGIQYADKLIVSNDSPQLYSDLPYLLAQPEFANSPAVKDNEVYIIQNGTFGENPKDFLADVEILAEIIQPKYFIYGREGEDWVRFELSS